MKTVCEVLGTARSAVAVKRVRSPDWQDGRGARVSDDVGRPEDIRAHVAPPADLRLPGYPGAAAPARPMSSTARAASLANWALSH
jgi:hypothetical protein